MVVLIACAACGPHSAASSAHPKPGVEITLYRDHAVVAHRLDVVIPPAAPAKLTLRIAAGVEPSELYLVEASSPPGLEIRNVEVLGAAPDKPVDGCDEVSCVLDSERACCARFERKPSEWDDETTVIPIKKQATRTPLDVEITIGGPRAGTFSVVIGYDTPRIDWDATYTLTTTASHRRGELRGALAVRNATGIAFSAIRLAVVDRDQGDLASRSKLEDKPTRADDTPIAQPRTLGRFDLVEGDSRIELVDHAVPLRPVLVFDPIGPSLDYQHEQPVQDANLGVNLPPSTRLIENALFDRTPAIRNLPGGPVRTFERKPDGALALLTESRLFGTETLAAVVDTVPLGTAAGVTGKRERRELTIDNDRKRIVEEFALTIDNTRSHAIDLLLREHLYRGTGWSIAYNSVFQVEKEGMQQLALRTVVPARAKHTVLYVVVYEWGKSDQQGPKK